MKNFCVGPRKTQGKVYECPGYTLDYFTRIGQYKGERGPDKGFTKEWGGGSQILQNNVTLFISQPFTKLFLFFNTCKESKFHKRREAESIDISRALDILL